MSRNEDGSLNGYIGPWVTLHESGTEQTFLIFTFHEEDDWEPCEDEGAPESGTPETP